MAIKLTFQIAMQVKFNMHENSFQMSGISNVVKVIGRV